MTERPRTGDPQAHLPLSPAVWHILLALADEERHGYAIMREVAERTDGRTRIGPGTLYGSLKRLLEAGLVEESGERPDPALDDERRRYYRLTDFGRRVAQAEAQRLEQMVHSARAKRLLGGPSQHPLGDLGHRLLGDVSQHPLGDLGRRLLGGASQHPLGDVSQPVLGESGFRAFGDASQRHLVREA
jgi:DNA-binding PadR family transcriptional regulator